MSKKNLVKSTFKFFDTWLRQRIPKKFKNNVAWINWVRQTSAADTQALSHKFRTREDFYFRLLWTRNKKSGGFIFFNSLFLKRLSCKIYECFSFHKTQLKTKRILASTTKPLESTQRTTKHENYTEHTQTETGHLINFATTHKIDKHVKKHSSYTLSKFLPTQKWESFIYFKLWNLASTSKPLHSSQPITKPGFYF